MSDKLKLKALVVPAPAPTFAKLLVLKDLTIGTAVYSKGDTIEVFLHEANRLIEEHGDYFEVKTS